MPKDEAPKVESIDTATVEYMTGIIAPWIDDAHIVPLLRALAKASYEKYYNGARALAPFTRPGPLPLPDQATLLGLVGYLGLSINMKAAASDFQNRSAPQRPNARRQTRRRSYIDEPNPRAFRRPGIIGCP